MPRVKALTAEQRAVDAFYNFIKVQNVIHGIKQVDLADALGVSQADISYKLKKRTFTVCEICEIIVNVYGMNIGDAFAEIERLSR